MIFMQCMKKKTHAILKPIKIITMPMPMPMPILNDLKRVFNKLTPQFWYAAVAFLFACMIWVSPGDDVLGKALMAAFIVALTLYHRIAGILAVIAVIVLMQITNQREGMTQSNPLVPTTPPITFATAAEFKEKYCMKGVTQSGATDINTEYMMSPSLFNDNNGKLQLKMEVIKQMNMSTLNESNGCKSTPPNSTNPNDYITLTNICDPGCMWSTNPTAASTPAPTAPRTVSSEGFTPMLHPHIRKAKHAVSGGISAVQSGASRLQRQLF